MRVQIKSADVVARSGVSSKGKPYTLNEQTAWVSFSDGQVRKFKLVVDHAYPVGDYEVSDDSYTVDRFDNLGLARVKLVPVAAAVRKVG